MKKHTKLVTLFLAGAMALSLAACRSEERRVGKECM